MAFSETASVRMMIGGTMATKPLGTQAIASLNDRTFVVACILAFASGTSWGTFGILIPIVTAVFPADSTLLIIGISACCAGAVCGDHCSPISDTTIMASAGAQCLHLDHVSTQLPYAVTVAIVSFVGFIVAGFVQNVLITWLVSAALLLGILLFLRARERKKEA